MAHAGLNETLTLPLAIGATGAPIIKHVSVFDIARYFHISKRNFDVHPVIEQIKVLAGPTTVGAQLVVVVDDVLEGQGSLITESPFIIDLDDTSSSGSRSRKAEIFQVVAGAGIDAVFFLNGRPINSSLTFVRSADDHLWIIQIHYHLEKGSLNFLVDQSQARSQQVVPLRVPGGPFFQPQKAPGEDYFQTGGQRGQL